MQAFTLWAVAKLRKPDRIIPVMLEPGQGVSNYMVRE